MDLDGLKGIIRAMVRKEVARLDYLALYPAKVLADHGNNTYDLEPFDVRLPKLVKVPLAQPIPGITIKVAAGARVLLGFTSGNPSAPRVTLWETSENVTIVLTSADIRLGSEGVTKHVALAEDVKANFDALKSYLDGHQHPETGGTTSPPLAPSPAPGNMNAAKVKAE